MGIKIYAKLTRKSLPKKFVLMGSVFFLFVGSFNGVQAGSSLKCHFELEPDENSLIAYKQRGSGNSKRWEGFYTDQVGAVALDVIGVVKGSFQFKLQKSEVIKISSPTVNDRPICVTAKGPIRSNYRMDAKIDPNQTLSWTVADVLYGQLLHSSEEIGVFGWIKEEANQMIYVPVHAKAKSSANKQDGIVRLFLRAAADLEQAWWRFVSHSNCSSPRDWRGASTKGKSIRITLPSCATGKLCLEVVAKRLKMANQLKDKICLLVGAEK